jgi:hypothetical protein
MTSNCCTSPRCTCLHHLSLHLSRIPSPATPSFFWLYFFYRFFCCVKGIDLEQFPAILVDGLHSSGKIKEGTSLLIAGWGTTEYEGPVAEVLMESTVDVVSQNSCNAAYEGIITDDMLCAYGKNTDACQGDSGGPLFGLNFDGTVTQVLDTHSRPQKKLLQSSISLHFWHLLS